MVPKFLNAAAARGVRRIHASRRPPKLPDEYCRSPQVCRATGPPGHGGSPGDSRRTPPPAAGHGSQDADGPIGMDRFGRLRRGNIVDRRPGNRSPARDAADRSLFGSGVEVLGHFECRAKFARVASSPRGVRRQRGIPSPRRLFAKLRPHLRGQAIRFGTLALRSASIARARAFWPDHAEVSRDASRSTAGPFAHTRVSCAGRFLY